MNREDLEQLRDRAAEVVLKARARIEAAVDEGELPAWVLELCDHWERSSLVYGITSEQLKNQAPGLPNLPPGALLH